MLPVCRSVDFAVDNIRLAPLYLTLLAVTAAISVVWILRRQRSSILERQWHAPTPFLEHKSLESTINDFHENAFRQPVGNLGKGILDEQSEEIDANESPNNFNFFQQLAFLKCTADGKLTAPQNKFKLSAFTGQSKLFGNVFTTPSIGDNCGRIDVNLTAIEQVKKGDFDQNEKYLERGSSNMDCHGLFNNRQNMAEHIEVELNMALTVVKNKNIPIKPYDAPSETNVTDNEEPDQILVFDGKGLTLQPDIPEKVKNSRETLLPNSAPTKRGKSSQNYVNFSVIQQVGKDDLDDIDKDLERGLSNVIQSENIEVDQNMTHTDVKNDEDMSIMNTVHILLQDVSESAFKDKKATLNNDWVTDKENIPINPYAAPFKTNVTVNEEPDQVLVFDSKGLTLQPDIPEKDKNSRETLLPNSAPLMSGKSSQNYVIQQVEKDNLDDIDKDLERGLSNVIQFGNIEVDQNMTHTVVKNDEDLSITDTVHSSLQDVSKSSSTDIKVSLNKDFVVDKENIASNLYASQSCKSGTELEQVAIFDVKRSTLLPDILKEDKDYRKTLVPNSFAETPQSFVLDVNDDFLKKSNDGMLNSKNSGFSGSVARRKQIKRDGNEILDTVPVHKVVITPKRTHTCMKKLHEKASKRETLVFNDGTRSWPANMMLPDKQTQQKCLTLKHSKYENDSGIISDTQTFPINLFFPNNNTSPERQQTVLHEDPKNPKRRRTVVYEDDTGNISVTQPLLSNILPEKVQLDDNKENNKAENILNTQSFLNYIVEINSKTSRYRMFDGEASISMALAISANNYLLDEIDPSADVKNPEEIKEVKEKVIDDGIIEEAINKIKTITYDEVDTDEGDIFMTGAISTNIMKESTNERKTMAYDEADSKSLVTSTNVYFLDKLDSAGDITKPTKSITLPFIEKVIDYGAFEQDNLKPTEDGLRDNRESTATVANNFDSETSTTMGIATVPSLLQTEKRRTVIFDNDECNISMKHPTLYTTETKSSNLTKQNLAANRQLDIIGLQAFTTNTQQLTASIGEQINLKNPLYRVSTSVNQNDKKANNSKVVTPNTKNVLSLPVIPAGAIVMPVHPRGIEKLQVKLIISTTDRTIDKVSEGDDDPVTKESLSNISDQTLQRGTYDKSLMAILESDPPSAVMSQDAADNTFNESMFYIMKDSEVITQTDRKMGNKAKKANPKDEEERVVHLQRTSELISVTQNSALPSRSFEIDKRNEHVNIKQQSDNSSRPSDTQDLLDLISNFTGNVVCEDNIQPSSIKVEDQGETTEHKPVSGALNGQSIASSREHLLGNILMALELLQKCRLALDGCDCTDEDTRNAFVEISNKSDRSSYKVDKTFKFGDESISEASLTKEEKFCPLKKTVFGETYMYETKGKVVSTYFKDVSDGIKEVMLDLVKPISNDNIVETKMIDRDVTQNIFTHSAQIQDNLDTSSHKKENTLKPKQSAVLVFDHLIPLNNVLLAPNYSKDKYKYNSKQTDETLCGSRKLLKKISKDNNYEAETLTNTETFTIMPEPSTRQDDICVYQNDDRFSKKDDQFSSQSTSTTCGCIPVDQSVEAISRHLRNDEVNFIMEMKKNKELLRASLSLELVENASEDANGVLTSDTNKHTNLKVKFSISPHVNIKGEAANIVKAAKLSGISIRQGFNSSSSSKTWICSPSTGKHEQHSPSEEVTPKPISKIYKISKSHKVMFPPEDPTKPLRTEEAFFIFVEQSFRPSVPVFDRLSPVNNIRHSSTDLADPRKTDQTFFSSASKFNKMSKGDYEVKEALTTTQNTVLAEQHSDNTLTKLLNTLHALVNKLTPEKDHPNHGIKSSTSALVDSEIQAAGIDSIAKITKISLGDQYYSTKLRANSVKNGKKQVRIPSRNTYKQDSPAVKVTRKSIKKMQKYSTNPKPRIEPSKELYSEDDFTHSILSIYTHSMVPEKDVTETNNTDDHSSTICEEKSQGTKDTSVFSVDKPCKSAVLVFDLQNPLNNIVLAPTYFMDVHKYNPIHTEETLCGPRNRFTKISKGNDNEMETVTTTLYTRMPEPTTMQDDVHYIYQKGVQFELQHASSTSGSISVEESRDAILKHLRNDEVNTMIAMRGNQESLKPRSSLALVTEVPGGNRVLTPHNNEHSTTQYTRMPEPTTMQDVKYIYQKGDHYNLQLASSTSGFISVRDAKVNTTIAMRGNQQLLAASSSLTLDNDETGENRILTSDNNEHSNHRTKMSRSPPVNIEGQAAKTASIGKLSEISLEDQFYNFDSSVSVTKFKKRIYIPSTDMHKQYLKFFSVEVLNHTK